MTKIDYPQVIHTEQELNIFFDYVTHCIIEHYEEYSNHIIFNGCHTVPTPYNHGVEVHIPLKIPQLRAYEIQQLFKEEYKKVVSHIYGIQSPFIKIDLRLEIEMYDVCTGAITFKEREEENMYVPEVRKIIHRKSNRGEFFTVEWCDNTTTTVKLMEGEESDEYTAFLYAVGKKMFNDKGKARAYIKEKKKVFEDEVAKKSAERTRKRKLQAIQQSLDTEDLDDISDEVYCAGFVAPCMVSKAMFKKNKR